VTLLKFESLMETAARTEELVVIVPFGGVGGTNPMKGAAEPEGNAKHTLERTKTSARSRACIRMNEVTPWRFIKVFGKAGMEHRTARNGPALLEEIYKFPVS
jgi:hypothetical protein